MTLFQLRTTHVFPTWMVSVVEADKCSTSGIYTSVRVSISLINFQLLKAKTREFHIVSLGRWVDWVEAVKPQKEESRLSGWNAEVFQ